MTTSIDIKIQGREYRVACAPEELDSLQAAADLLNRQMGEIAKATKTTGERLAVMTALNLAAELNSTAKLATSGAPPQGIDDEVALRRIKSIEARLDEALSAQNKLF